MQVCLFACMSCDLCNVFCYMLFVLESCGDFEEPGVMYRVTVAPKHATGTVDGFHHP